MPVSPQDFELYSRMTGAPMPSDAMSRMQMAPDVYKFTKNYAKKPNLLQKTGNVIKNIGKTTLVGAGMLAGMDLDNQARQKQELMRNEADKAQSEAVSMSDPIEQEKLDSPAMAKIRLQMEADAIKHKNKLELQDRMDARAGFSKVMQEPTSADSYGQDRVQNQTSSQIVDRKLEQGSQLADETPNVAEVLSKSQDSTPSEIGKGLGKDQLAKFLGQKGINQSLLGAISERTLPQPRIGDNSPLLDHPDVIGGEDDATLPGGTNTSPTQDLNSFYKEMRKMDAQERSKRVSPSDKQMNLLEKRAIDNENALKSGFMNLDDEGRAKETARLGGDRIREMAKKSPDAISGTDIKRTGLLSGQLTRFPAGEETRKAEERKRLRRERNANMSTSEKADDFTAKFVEGARSDIVRGKRGNQSLGITRIPATNGDAQVGFVLANKPLDQNPTKATTYGYGVAPGAESLLDNQLNQDSFSDYMNRGRSEAREGKKRKAGEIFEFLPKSRRVVRGTASLGDIVM